MNPLYFPRRKLTVLARRAQVLTVQQNPNVCISMRFRAIFRMIRPAMPISYCQSKIMESLCSSFILVKDNQLCTFAEAKPRREPGADDSEWNGLGSTLVRLIINGLSNVDTTWYYASILHWLLQVNNFQMGTAFTVICEHTANNRTVLCELFAICWHSTDKPPIFGVALIWNFLAMSKILSSFKQVSCSPKYESPSIFMLKNSGAC